MKMKKIDYIIMAVFLLTLLVLVFFWGCQYDPIVSLFGLVILAESLIVTYSQYNKLKDLEAETEQIQQDFHS